MNAPTPTVLLVEDNDDDVFLMQRALKQAKINFPLQVVVNGQEALDYLNGAGKFSNRAQYPVPGLIFLDLKLPYIHGFEVLDWIRQHEPLKALPVIVLTSSAEDRDRQRAQALDAKAFLVKPPNPEMLLQAMRFLNPAA
jgi:CheY-like chemotaxis protein